MADGGSTDATLEILRAAADIDLVLDSRPDNGIYDAMNRALSLATGEYYVVLGADDLLYSDAIDWMSQSVEMLEPPDLVVFGVRFGDELRVGRWCPDRAWLGSSHVVTAHSVGMLVRRSIHDVVGKYSLSYPLCADALFIKRVSVIPRVNVVISPHFVGEFGLSGASNSNTARGLCEGYLIQLSTERSPVLQTLIFVLRLLKNLSRIYREAKCLSTKEAF